MIRLLVGVGCIIAAVIPASPGGWWALHPWADILLGALGGLNLGLGISDIVEAHL